MQQFLIVPATLKPAKRVVASVHCEFMTIELVLQYLLGPYYYQAPLLCEGIDLPPWAAASGWGTGYGAPFQPGLPGSAQQPGHRPR